MNAMDVIPVDLLPLLAGMAGVSHLKVVPSTDLNATFAMSIAVFFLIYFYSIKVKGFGGFGKEVLFSPFGKFPLLIPVNILFRIVEDIAKPISLALRLFGNMYAGDGVYPDRAVALVSAMDVGRAMGNLPPVDYYAASLRVYDADDCLPQHGSRKPLKVSLYLLTKPPRR
jgi:hypothetical protein